MFVIFSIFCVVFQIYQINYRGVVLIKKKSIYSIRKLSVGIASISLGSVLVFGGHSASAAEQDNPSDHALGEENKQTQTVESTTQNNSGNDNGYTAGQNGGKDATNSPSNTGQGEGDDHANDGGGNQGNDLNTNNGNTGKGQGTNNGKNHQKTENQEIPEKPSENDTTPDNGNPSTGDVNPNNDPSQDENNNEQGQDENNDEQGQDENNDEQGQDENNDEQGQNKGDQGQSNGNNDIKNQDKDHEDKGHKDKDHEDKGNHKGNNGENGHKLGHKGEKDSDNPNNHANTGKGEDRNHANTGKGENKHPGNNGHKEHPEHPEHPSPGVKDGETTKPDTKDPEGTKDVEKEQPKSNETPKDCDTKGDDTESSKHNLGNTGNGEVKTPSVNHDKQDDVVVPKAENHYPKHSETEKVTHVVTPGETVKDIAKHYGTTPEQVAKDNHLANEDVIVSGQKVVVERPAEVTDNNTQEMNQLPETGSESNNPFVGGAIALGSLSLALGMALLGRRTKRQ